MRILYKMIYVLRWVYGDPVYSDFIMIRRRKEGAGCNTIF